MSSMSKTVAYLRVSTIDQDLDKNRAAILQLAHEKKLGHIEFIEEKVSGKVAWRNRKIFTVLESLNQNDNLIVSELSRLRRSMCLSLIVYQSVQLTFILCAAFFFKRGKPYSY